MPLGLRWAGLQLLGGSSAPLLADRQERENKQVQDMGKNELVEARGGKQWQVNTAEQEEKDVYVRLFKVCSRDKCKSVRRVSLLSVLWTLCLFMCRYMWARNMALCNFLLARMHTVKFDNLTGGWELRFEPQLQQQAECTHSHVYVYTNMYVYVCMLSRYPERGCC